MTSSLADSQQGSSKQNTSKLRVTSPEHAGRGHACRYGGCQISN